MITTQNDKFPPLPKSQANGDNTTDFHGRMFEYTADQMRAYGQLCIDSLVKVLPPASRSLRAAILALRYEDIGPICTEARNGYSLGFQHARDAAAALATSAAPCVCGEPDTAGTIHRTDGPCHQPDTDDAVHQISIDGTNKLWADATETEYEKHIVTKYRHKRILHTRPAHSSAPSEIKVIDIGHGATLQRQMKTTGAVGWLMYNEHGLVRSLNGLEIQLVESTLAAALAAPTGESLPVQGVPEGWQLVPKEATLEMCDATQVKIGGCYSCSAQIPDWGACKEIYADMLSAAPAPTGASK